MDVRSHFAFIGRPTLRCTHEHTPARPSPRRATVRASGDLPPPQETEAGLGEQLWLFHHNEVPHFLHDAAFGQPVRDRGNRVHHRLFGDVIIRLTLEQEDRAFDLVQMLAHIVSFQASMSATQVSW